MNPTRSIALLLTVSVGAAALRAETHQFVPQTFVTTFSASHAPVLRLKSGDRVQTATADVSAAGTGQTSTAGLPPQTGPFFVEGAEPGDLLVVTIERLEPRLTVGHSRSNISPNAVPQAALSRRPDTNRYAWSIDKARGVVRLDLQAAMPGVSWRARFDAPAFELPLRATLGSIAVAPADQGAEASAAAGRFGGNMAAAGLGIGARVMLPVLRPGALLFLGQGLAAKGDGAVTGTGIETPLDVEFTVEVVKRRDWPHSSVVRGSTVVGEFAMGAPRIETGDYLMAMGIGPSLAQALQQATIELHHWLDDDFGLNERSVSVLVGQALEYEVATLAEPHVTVVAKVRKAYLPRTASAP
jgi:acetamidase/formamidase